MPGTPALQKRTPGRWPDNPALAATTPPPAPLLPWSSAFAARETAPASVLVVSDSTAEGVGISSVNARWIERLRDGLRTRYPVSGVAAGVPTDYYPAYYSAGGGGVAASGPARTAGVTTSSTWGLGRRAAVLPATTTTDTITFVLPACTRFQVCVSRNSTSTLGIQVDGGAVQSFDYTRTDVGGYVVLDSGTIAAGTHTVVLNRIAGGAITVEGVHAYHGNDDVRGVRVLDGAQSGQANSHFAGSGFWAMSTTVEQPDLVLWGLGYNDYLNRVSFPTFPGLLTTARTSVRVNVTAKTPSFVYVILPEPKYTNGTPASAPWRDYVAAIKDVAAADPLGLSCVLDLSVRYPKWLDPGTNYGMVQSDRIHPTDKGAAWIADAVERFITRV